LKPFLPNLSVTDPNFVCGIYYEKCNCFLSAITKKII